MGVDGGGGDIVRRGEGARAGTFKLDEPSTESCLGSMAGLSVSGFGGGSVDSGERTIVVGAGDSTMLRADLKDPSSGSSRVVRLPNVPARGVLSSSSGSSGLRLIGGSLESPSTRP